MTNWLNWPKHALPAVAAAIVCVAASTAAHANGPFGHEPTPVIYDTDVDFDDTAALAYLSALHRAGRIELLAVTVTNNGAGLPGRAIFHTRCLLKQLGLGSIPVADATYPGGKPFPVAIQQAVEGVENDLFAGCTESTESSAISAPQLIVDTVLHSRRPVAIVATGPLTNLAKALDLPGGKLLPFWVSELTIEGGAVHAPGNVTPTPTDDGSQDFNTWADAPAAQKVFEAFWGARISLVPLDATQNVPVTADYAARILSDHATPEANFVASLVSHPLIQFAILFNLGFFWWDPLAAVSFGAPGVVTFELEKIAVVQSGVSEGRTVQVGLRDRGSWLRVGVTSSKQAFEDAFLDGLNGRF